MWRSAADSAARAAVVHRVFKHGMDRLRADILGHRGGELAAGELAGGRALRGQR